MMFIVTSMSLLFVCNVSTCNCTRTISVVRLFYMNVSWYLVIIANTVMVLAPSRVPAILAVSMFTSELMVIVLDLGPL